VLREDRNGLQIAQRRYGALALLVAVYAAELDGAIVRRAVCVRGVVTARACQLVRGGQIAIEEKPTSERFDIARRRMMRHGGRCKRECTREYDGDERNGFAHGKSARCDTHVTPR